MRAREACVRMLLNPCSFTQTETYQKRTTHAHTHTNTRTHTHTHTHTHTLPLVCPHRQRHCRRHATGPPPVPKQSWRSQCQVCPECLLLHRSDHKQPSKDSAQCQANETRFSSLGLHPVTHTTIPTGNLPPNPPSRSGQTCFLASLGHSCFLHSLQE